MSEYRRIGDLVDLIDERYSEAMKLQETLKGKKNPQHSFYTDIWINPIRK